MSDKNMTTLQASKRQLNVDPRLLSRNVRIKYDEKIKTKTQNEKILIMHSSEIPYNTNGHKQSGGSFNITRYFNQEEASNYHINRKSRQITLDC